MPKQRGFQPQGLTIAPVQRSRVADEGQTLMERVNRETRPTWDELRTLVKKKQSQTAEYLEQFENENFREELNSFRDSRLAEQEKEDLEAVRQSKKKNKSRAKKSDNPYALSTFFQMTQKGGLTYENVNRIKDRGKNSKKKSSSSDSAHRKKKRKSKKRWRSSSSSSAHRIRKLEKRK